MTRKQEFLRLASFLGFIYLLLGYTVKFYPEQLTTLDTSFQAFLRGSLPEGATAFWTRVTVLGNEIPLFLTIFLLGACFYWKKWKAESLFVVGSLVAMGIFSSAFKLLYQRPRPDLDWLVDTFGYSFPSWHAASTCLVALVLGVICRQRLGKTWLAYTGQLVLAILAVLVGLSRVYVGVHYPTDIVGGWLLAGVLVCLIYPYYDQLRFIWRFQGKQK